MLSCTIPPPRLPTFLQSSVDVRIFFHWLLGGQRGALRYSVIFAVVGTTVDYATLRLAPIIRNFRESHKDGDWLKLPEWSPIQVLDEEALAEKKAREQKLYAQTQQALGKLRKEES